MVLFVCKLSAVVTHMTKTDGEVAFSDVFYWHTWRPEGVWVHVSLEVQALQASQIKIVLANQSTVYTPSHTL